MATVEQELRSQSHKMKNTLDLCVTASLQPMGPSPDFPLAGNTVLCSKTLGYSIYLLLQHSLTFPS